MKVEPDRITHTEGNRVITRRKAVVEVWRRTFIVTASGFGGGGLVAAIFGAIWPDALFYNHEQIRLLALVYLGLWLGVFLVVFVRVWDQEAAYYMSQRAQDPTNREGSSHK